MCGALVKGAVGAGVHQAAVAGVAIIVVRGEGHPPGERLLHLRRGGAPAQLRTFGASADDRRTFRETAALPKRESG